MPGIVIALKKVKSPHEEDRSTQIAQDVSDEVYGGGRLKCQKAELFPGVSVKINHLKPNDWGILKSDQWVLTWYGWPCFRNRPIDRDSFNELQRALASGKVAEWMDEVTGHFQIVLISSKSKELLFFSDKAGSLPAYYTELPDYFVFSPEPLPFRVLKKYNWEPSFREGAVYEYLACGHFWGDRTFWNEVRRIGPGQYLNISDDQITVKKYFQLDFKTGAESNEELRNLFSEGTHRDIEIIPDGKIVLALSGGYDSRYLMGLLQKHGRTFETVSYSFGEEFSSDSDWGLAKYFSQKAGVPFQYFQADLSDVSRVIEDFHKVIRASSGECDQTVIQDAFLGERFFEGLAESYDCLIRGDQVYGMKDPATSQQMAFWETYLFNLNEFLPLMDQFFDPDHFNRGVEFIARSREEYAREYPDGERDYSYLKEFLFWRHREARFIINQAYNKRCYINHIAPFLFGNAFPVIKKAPSKLVNRKKLFLQAAEMEFPELFKKERTANPYLNRPKHYDLILRAPEFQSFVADQMANPSSYFEGFFDAGKLDAWVKQTLDNASQSERERGQARKIEYNFKKSVQNCLVKYPAIVANAKRLFIQYGGMKYPHSNNFFLLRLLVLNLALKQYEQS